MNAMTSNQLRQLYLAFFKSKGHAVIASASLIPENDPTVLFTTAGMHPLVPYLMGEKHPSGQRLTDVQKCVRTGDIDEVGDSSHCTFFEMLGNWSLGDYFKEDAIRWSYEFLTDKKYLNLPKQKLVVSVFAGDDAVPRDEESAKLWQSCGLQKSQIFYLPRKNNWWGPAGQTGPCGPDTEIFIDTGKQKCSDSCSPACDCGKYLEIWNNVFMQYNKQKDGSFVPLSQKNVDTGMGLERTICVLNHVKSVYETDVFEQAVALLQQKSGVQYTADCAITKAFRIVCDHIRTATFLLGDRNGITPSNVDQGYVLRRLIRRAVRYGRKLNLPEGTLCQLSELFIQQYKDAYCELLENKAKILQELNREEIKFSKTLLQGMKEFEKMASGVSHQMLDGQTAFKLYDTYGFPIEITTELATERGMQVDVQGFYDAYAEHQKKSQMGAEQKFKGGLQDDNLLTARLHTATHLMHAALRQVLNESVEQKGSNITSERLRFDFNFARPMTADEISQVEQLVNVAIAANAVVECSEMTVDQAKRKGAIGLFESKYGTVVKVYRMGAYSMEICGGPHATTTGELGRFKIIKEQSSAAGVRRIKAILE